MVFRDLQQAGLEEEQQAGPQAPQRAGPQGRAPPPHSHQGFNVSLVLFPACRLGSIPEM